MAEFTETQIEKLNTLKKDYKYTNEKIKKANYNKLANNKSLYSAITSVDVNQFIDKITDKPRIRKSIYKQKYENILTGTQKPVFTNKGLMNPVKLNLSQDTINKIKKNK